MNPYKLLKLYRRIQSPRLKLLGLMALHVGRRRYLNMVFDPVLGCNLRCRMCYFSDPQVRRQMHGIFSDADIEAIARALFHRVMRLQIGCGAEPTLYPRLAELVATARRHGVPHISLTTNGQLLSAAQLDQLARSGLDELIISAHGLCRETYEEMMPQASFDRFSQLVDDVRNCRRQHPGLSLRLNYTVNADNLSDLRLMPALLERLAPDTLQLRPVQQIGEQADYQNYSLGSLVERYDECLQPVVDYCREHGITCLYPLRDHLQAIGSPAETDARRAEIELLPYFQLSPYDGWQQKIDPHRETFEQYCRRTHRLGRMWRLLLGLPLPPADETLTKALNYNVK